ncbi:MAG TPA: redoxin domain-containing protein [Dongiaceae bacterium]|nr:redoxin domain-containing protein [Dongiaceae bacterium]
MLSPRRWRTIGAALVAALACGRSHAAPVDPRAARDVAGLLLGVNHGRVEVMRVLTGSPADRAGFLPGDVVLVVGNTPVIDLRPLAPAEVLRLIDRTPGDPLRLVVGRGSRTFGAFLPRATSAAKASTGPLAPPAVGDRAPDFEATALGGAKVSLAALKGRPVLIDFWASWCPPCGDSALVVRRLADQYGSRLAVVGVSLDDDPKAFEAFVYNHHLPGQQIHDGGPRGPLSRLYAAASAGLPFAVLVDAQGVVAGVDRSPGALEATLESLLGSNPRGGA